MDHVQAKFPRWIQDELQNTYDAGKEDAWNSSREKGKLNGPRIGDPPAFNELS